MNSVAEITIEIQVAGTTAYLLGTQRDFPSGTAGVFHAKFFLSADVPRNEDLTHSACFYATPSLRPDIDARHRPIYSVVAEPTASGVTASYFTVEMPAELFLRPNDTIYAGINAIDATGAVIYTSSLCRLGMVLPGADPQLSVASNGSPLWKALEEATQKAADAAGALGSVRGEAAALQEQAEALQGRAAALENRTQVQVILSGDEMPDELAEATEQYQAGLAGTPALREGDVILGKNGRAAVIKAIELDQGGQIYDVTVEGSGVQLLPGAYCRDVTADYCAARKQNPGLLARDYLAALPDGQYQIREEGDTSVYFSRNVDVLGCLHAKITEFCDDAYAYRYKYAGGRLGEIWEASGTEQLASVSAQQIADNTSRIAALEARIAALEGKA